SRCSTNKSNEAYEPTILYYPNIEVPTSGPWIRRALLYRDDLGCNRSSQLLRLHERSGHKVVSPQTSRILRAKDFPADKSRQTVKWTGSQAQAFTTDWESLVASQRRRFRSANHPERTRFKDKTSQLLFHELEARGLAADAGNPEPAYRGLV